MSLNQFSVADASANVERGGRYPQLDALRGLAIAFVFVYHLYPNRLPGGYVGVDLFFVLSGYLVALTVRKDHFSIPKYLWRRVERLLPPLLAMLMACMAVGFVLLFSSEYAQLARHAFKSLLFVQNLQLESELDYFDKELQLKPLANLWSLSVEMQFYLLAVPLVHLVSKRFSVRQTQAILVVAIIVALLVSTFLHGASYYDAVPRLVPFLGGALLGYSMPKTPMPAPLSGERSSWGGISALALCFVGLLALALTLDGATRYPGWVILVPTMFALGLVQLSATSKVSSFIARRLGSLVYLGLISYSLYLWHWPIISFAKIQMSGDSFSTVLKLQIAMVSVVAGWLSYRFIEQAAWPKRLIRPAYAAGLMGVGGVLAAVAFVLSSHPVTYAKLAQRDDQGLANAAAAKGLYQWRFKDKDCQQRVSFDPPQCRFHDRGYRPSIAILGDSHAGALFDGLDQAMSSQQLGVIHLGAPGCPPFYDLNHPPTLYKSWEKCSIAINPALDYVRNNKDIETIVLSVYFDWSRKDEPSFDSELMYEGEARLKGGMAWKASMRRTLSALLASGKKLVFVLDVPHLGFDPKSCKTLRPVLGDAKRQAACHQSRQDIDQWFVSSRQAHIIDALKEFPEVLVVNAADAVCDQSRCYGLKDGLLLYSDSNHLSVAGSVLVGKLIAERMRSAQFIGH
ncbi:MAG TPA: acyltransferase family protein [Limnobacter sp.]|uniref:acyltransferase family protein n=1 Tax=Limnobacter sp. TaxID=2003368 RepID=UPI002EDBAD14